MQSWYVLTKQTPLFITFLNIQMKMYSCIQYYSGLPNIKKVYSKWCSLDLVHSNTALERIVTNLGTMSAAVRLLGSKVNEWLSALRGVKLLSEIFEGYRKLLIMLGWRWMCIVLSGSPNTMYFVIYLPL